MSSVAGKAPAPPPAATLAMPPPTWQMRDPNDEVAGGSRASDAGSVKGDSASEAGSTATMDTSMSAGTLASGASTAYLSQQVHSFTLDDFAGHAIQTILEDNPEHADELERADHLHDDDGGLSQDGQQSVRPGSIVSNLEQRLDDLDGCGPTDLPAGSSAHGAGDKEDDNSAWDSGGTSARAAQEAQYFRLLQQMQHRDLTPEDLQLLMMIEKERAERHRSGELGSRSGNGKAPMMPPAHFLGGSGPAG